MTAFDTDILTDISKNVPAVIAQAAGVPAADRYVPIVAAEEALRGQLAAIRRAQSGGGRHTIEEAYAYFEETLSVLRGVQVLPYTTTAEALFKAWRAMKLRLGTQDLRIAAICFAHGAKLVTRNARDYAQVPGLNLEVWP